MWQSEKKGRLKNNALGRASGFMVVEVMVSLVLAGLLIISVMAVLSATRRLQTDSRQRQQALDYGREALEIMNDIYHAEFIKTGATPCAPLPEYTNCWTDLYGNPSTKLKLVNTGSTWELQEISGSNCFQIASNPDFFRTITIENIGPTLPDDRSNDVKKVNATVYWPTCEASHNITLSTVLTAWKNI